MDLKGQKMLKVCSILMIIGGAIALLFSVLAIVGVAAISTLTEGDVSSAYIWLAFAIVASVVQLVAGVVGFQAAKMPSINKIKISLISGLLVVVLSLVSSIATIVISGFDTSSLVGLTTGLVIPVLYLIGLIQYKNALVALLSGD